MKLDSFVTCWFAVCTAAVLSVAAQNEPLYMRFERDENIVTLTCLNGDRTVSIAQARFFRNGVRIESSAQFQIVEAQLTARITREVEGNYTCGNGTAVSNTVPIIGKQRFNNIIHRLINFLHGSINISNRINSI